MIRYCSAFSQMRAAYGGMLCTTGVLTDWPGEASSFGRGSSRINSDPRARYLAGVLFCVGHRFQGGTEDTLALVVEVTVMGTARHLLGGGERLYMHKAMQRQTLISQG
jgi:hypothetical protein